VDEQASNRLIQRLIRRTADFQKVASDKGEDPSAETAAEARKAAKQALADVMTALGGDWSGSPLLVLLAALEDLDRGRDHWLLTKRSNAQGRDNVSREFAKRTLAMAYWILHQTGTPSGLALEETVSQATRQGLSFQKGRNRGAPIRAKTLLGWCETYAPDEFGTEAQQWMAAQLKPVMILHFAKALDSVELHRLHRQVVAEAAHQNL
jgi:hypothetical protein